MTHVLNISRRQLTLGTAAVSAAASVPSALRAQGTWPNKPVKVVVPYPPGGGADTLSRLLFAKVQDDLGQPFVIENRGGGGGTIGAAVVAKAAPDGYTVLHDATAFSVNPALLPSLPYDSAKEFVPVFLAGRVPNLLVAHPSVEAKTVADVIAQAKAANGLDWASSGNGSVQHLALELFRARAAVQLNHIPFKGGGPALNDIMGGHVKYMFSNAAASTPHVKAGKLKAIAHTGTGRLSALPDVPPVADVLAGFEAYEWNGVFLPAGTPEPIVVRLNAALNASIAAPAVAERLAQLSIQSAPNTPADFSSFVMAETAKWTKVVRDGNIKPE
jgi:tripartite-type tricarboxylate transporter receptor subunit TctC